MKSVDSNNPELPIGFLDSGLGGLSVLKEAVRLMPNEDFIYFGDSMNAPYGTKEPEEIRRLTFAVVDYLMDKGIKGLAVACNTATGAAVRQLRIMYPDLPLVGIEPAVKPAVEQYKGGRILVMATPVTIEQEKFHNLLKKYADRADITPVPCKGLMEFVEVGDLESEELTDYLDKIVRPQLSDNVETIVLGCTHYPLLKTQLQKYLDAWQQQNISGPYEQIALIDGSFGTARELRRRLDAKGLLRGEDRTGTVTIENSSGDPKMIERSWKLFTT